LVRIPGPAVRICHQGAHDLQGERRRIPVGAQSHPTPPASCANVGQGCGRKVGPCSPCGPHRPGPLKEGDIAAMGARH
ncbi:MAG: hypothetical protein ACK55I_46305, partial [bacterium]